MEMGKVGVGGMVGRRFFPSDPSNTLVRMEFRPNLWRGSRLRGPFMPSEQTPPRPKQAPPDNVQINI